MNVSAEAVTGNLAAHSSAGTLQRVVVDRTNATVHFEGGAAVAFIAIVVLVAIAIALRFVRLRRRTRAATKGMDVAEAELRTLFAAMQDVVVVLDREGQYTRVPVTNANVLYRPTTDLIGKNISDILPAGAAETICALIIEAIETQVAVQAEYSIEFCEKLFWFSGTASPFDNNSALLVARDITEMKTARDAVVQSESRYRLLFDRNPSPMWVFDRETTRIVEVNDAAVAQYGYERAEFAQMTLSDLRAPEDVEHLTLLLKELPDDAPSTSVVKHRKKDGTTIDAEVRGHPLGVSGRNLRLVVSIDVTERLAAERVVRDAEARATGTSQMLQALIDVAPQAMIVMDRGWRITRWNGAAETLFGWTANDVVGTLLPIIPEDQWPKVQATRDVLMRGWVEKPAEGVRLNKDGTRIDVMVAVAPLLGPDNEPAAFIAVYMDLTARKLLEDQLRQAQKMEAIGTLAGGVAHDFNNILTIISLNSSMLQMDDRYPDIRNDLEEITTAARRATGLTRQLLTFSRKDIVQLRPIDINPIVTEMQPMLRRLLMAHIELIVKLDQDMGAIIADPSQIEQVLLNLAVNAADAMPNGGSLVVETHDVWLDEEYAEMHTGVTPGRYVLLAVTDSGTGMDAKTIRKIFEPFFTTKEVGRGTGLGLATVYAIVKQLGGHIWVYSEPEHGAAFKIYFPREQESLDEEPAPIRLGRISATGTVLLVEDDDAVRHTACRMLEKAGFSVVEAQDGQDGLRVASSYLGDINVVVTDLMMPRMNGADFARALAVTHPGLRVVFTSGYTDDSVLRRGLVDSTHAFVQKPFTGDQLVRTITQLLDATPPLPV